MTRTTLFFGAVLLAACTGNGGGDSDSGDDGLIDGIFLPDVTEAAFVTGVTNPYFPLPVGASWVYEFSTVDGLERIEVRVLNETFDIQGVTAVVVQDTATLDGEVIEDTIDWYAQDDEGNVWYLGEDTCEYEDGNCVSTEGSWKWGDDGALPGIAMPGTPTVDGQPYFQEYYVGHAEDVGEVLEVGGTASVAAGEFTDCVSTHDTSLLDETLDEIKHYCAGFGQVLIEEADTEEELIAYDGL